MIIIVPNMLTRLLFGYPNQVTKIGPKWQVKQSQYLIHVIWEVDVAVLKIIEK